MDTFYFKETQKKILWSLLALSLFIPNFLKIPIYVQLPIVSISCVMLGCLYSIVISKGQIAKQEGEETLTMKDIFSFPASAGLSLIVIYIIFQNLDPYWLNLIFKLLFLVLGIQCVCFLFVQQIPKIMPWLQQKEIMNINLKIFGEEIHFQLTTHNLLGYLISIVAGFFYMKTGFWIFNNIFGISFAISGIIFIKVNTFKEVILMEWLLFLFDIIFVFGTDIMVEVATKLDVPIKLLFVTDDFSKPGLLGLGDLVIPGIFVCLTLKFDVDYFLSNNSSEIQGKQLDSKIDNQNQQNQQNQQQTQIVHQEISTPCFNYTCFGYIIGMVMTIIGMFIMKSGQPALLYLVPSSCVGFLVGTIKEKRFMKMLRYNQSQREKPKLV